MTTTSMADNGGMMNVIRCELKDYIVWKWRPQFDGVHGPGERANFVRWGSSLRIKDGEMAVFVYSGPNKDGHDNQDFIMGPYDGVIETANLPVEQVSWNDCQVFIEKLNSITGRTFRLPTEAEWEFAARGGNYSRGYKWSGHGGNLATWFNNTSFGTTKTVATKQANELGLYDMSGNVWEWCSDWYDRNYYKNSDSNNPHGAYTGSYRVGRGGGWNSRAKSCRVSNRSYDAPDKHFNNLGLRLVLVP